MGFSDSVYKIFDHIKRIGAFFKGDQGGNILMTAALMFPMLLGAAGVSFDYVVIHRERSKLQDAADAAALASAKELSLSGANNDIIESVAKSYVESSYQLSQKNTDQSKSIKTFATVSKEDNSVKVDVSYYWKPFLAHYLDREALPIKVSATATLAGDSLTCILGLMQPQRLAKSSIHLDNNSVVQADNCAVYSNSVSKFGLRADRNAKMNAGHICSAGGVLNFGARSRSSLSPLPMTDCPKLQDPLEDRRAPSFGNCDYKALKVSSSKTLSPGVYCGGLTINSNAVANLSPGLYVIKDGPLRVLDKATLQGKDITFFLTGSASTFDFHPNTTIDLEAEKKGRTAGLLFFEDRNVPHSFDFNPFFSNPDRMPKNVRLHRISSNNAKNLLGTLYLSRSILLINSNAPVAEASAYTAIITGRLWLQEGPILHLNADLTDTKVPVPDGLMGTEPRLLY